MAGGGVEVESFLLVAAIDFGTMYSGFAFSTKDDFKKQPDKINTCEDLTMGYNFSNKIPTCLLLDKKGEFVSFGIEAEDAYFNHVISGEEDNFYYFHRFKMSLHTDGELSEDLEINDVSGKPLSAMKVFSLSIKALKESLLNSLKTHGAETIESRDILWVVTVPAIWTEPAKQFMRDAAESVSGTADITLHEKLGEGKLKELDKASGGASGGTAVDHQFFNLLSDIIGHEILQTMKTKQRLAYIELCREFESAKRRVKPEVEEKVNLGVLYHLNEFCTKTVKSNLDFQGVLQKSAFNKTVTTYADKVRIDSVVLKKMFQPVISDILSYINSILKQKVAKGIDVVLLVGGFSESKVVQDEIKKAYPKFRVVVPFDAGLSVVKGAVIFGHLPTTIESRVMKYSYCATYTEDKKQIFTQLVTAGDSVPLEHYVTKMIMSSTDVLHVKIYYSNHKSPKCVDDCWLFAEMPVPTPGQRRTMLQFVFGDTTLSKINSSMRQKI
ncbi:hypothetical protein KUTeg_011487 [Tegillarca granosa]|uniref:Uncharacterized protein n=1 Tax=Tegillarca granosa TaxID=220873 RepID=A0ABQ9F448_TEGGR|nr:hypothetical protein KUTeg_011487 [Tegillarca granosa]